VNFKPTSTVFIDSVEYNRLWRDNRSLSARLVKPALAKSMRNSPGCSSFTRGASSSDLKGDVPLAFAPKLAVPLTRTPVSQVITQQYGQQLRLASRRQ